MDPKNPGAVDEIIHLGDYWNEEGIKAHREDILKTNTEVGKLFSRAYRYMAAAGGIYEDSAVIHREALKKGEVNRLAEKLIEKLAGDRELAVQEGSQRCLFASAITPDGYLNYLDTILTVDSVYEIKGGMGTGEELILEKVRKAMLERGFNIEAYYCALNPEKLEHLVIPELNAAFTTSNSFHKSTVVKTLSIDLGEYMDDRILDARREDLNQNKAEFDRLMAIAIQSICRAKALHDRLETYYIPNIRFAEVDICFKLTLDRILKEEKVLQ